MKIYTGDLKISIFKGTDLWEFDDMVYEIRKLADDYEDSLALIEEQKEEIKSLYQRISELENDLNNTDSTIDNYEDIKLGIE